MHPGAILAPSSSNSHPTLDQLRKLRLIYKSEVEAIEQLLRVCETDFGKAYSVLSLHGQLYTAKRMLNCSAASQLHFKARLLVGEQQQAQAPSALPGLKDASLRVPESSGVAHLPEGQTSARGLDP